MQPLHWGSFCVQMKVRNPTRNAAKYLTRTKQPLSLSVLRLSQVTLGYKFEGLFGQR